MKDQLQALQTALVKLGYEYVRSTPGLTANEVNLTFLPPTEPKPTPKPGIDRIAEVLKLIADAGLFAASLGIFKCSGRSALVLQGLRILAAAAPRKGDPQVAPHP
jgi:hypothetical protein